MSTEGSLKQVLSGTHENLSGSSWMKVNVVEQQRELVFLGVFSIDDSGGQPYLLFNMIS